MEDLLLHPFTLGFALSLCFVAYTWRTSSLRTRVIRAELKKLRSDVAAAHQHLDRQMQLNSRDMESLEAEQSKLREENLALKDSISEAKQKPHGQERHNLLVYDYAVRHLNEHAPGFAGAWESSFRESEKEVEVPVEAHANPAETVAGFMRKLLPPGRKGPSTEVNEAGH